MPLQVTRYGLRGNTANEQEWRAFGKVLHSQHFSTQFAIGDWLNHGAEHYGIDPREVANVYGWSSRTASIYQFVASEVKCHNRNTKLSFTHHVIVAKYPDSAQARWLNRAARDNWTTEDLRAAIDGVASENARRFKISVDCKNETLMDQVVHFLISHGVKYKRHRSRTGAAIRGGRP